MYEFGSFMSKNMFLLPYMYLS